MVLILTGFLQIYIPDKAQNLDKKDIPYPFSYIRDAL
jgi:hypothetical protein